jgi:alpha-beta hydrolase superfamily lysophospholipase
VFLYFPDNYMWSLSFLRCLNAGGLLGEMDKAGARLRDAAGVAPNGDLEAWHREWYALGEELESLAEAASERGRTSTARDCYHRATQYYQWSEAFLPGDDERKAKAYGRHLECFRKAMELMDRRVDIVDVPYEEGPLPAYLVHADRADGEPVPAVVFFDGLDGNKEEFFPLARAIAERGVSCLAIDGPGQGEALKLRGIRSRHDYEVPGTAAYEWIAAREEIDSDRVAVMALSFGGYIAPRVAAYEKRYAACVAFGAQWDYRETWIRRLNIDPDSPVAAPAHHLFDVFGATDWKDALEKLEPFNLREVAPLVECPLLITHGEDDRQILLADAQALYDAAASEDKELRIYTREEGGSMHCQVDRPEPAGSYMADWLAERLGARRREPQQVQSA